MSNGSKRKGAINIYIHEKQYENICRDILLLTVLCERHMSQRERQEIFLDLYGNALLRDKTANYLEAIVNELIEFTLRVDEEDRCTSPLKEILNFGHLSWWERDKMVLIFSSYLKNHPFDMEKLRDQRMRHHFADRYDFRRNAIDWDF